MDELLYTLIARGSNVIMEAGVENAGGYENLARRIPAQLCHMAPGTRKTYTQDNKCFHCVVNSADLASQRMGDTSVITIIVLAPNTFKAERAFMFLTDVSQMFKNFEPPTSVQTLMPDYNGFAFQVSERMHFYSTDTNIERLREAQRHVDETKRVMMENIDLSINRGEKIESLAGKIDDMNANSHSFRVQAKRTKRKMCIENCRVCYLVCAIFLVVFLIAAGVGAYFVLKWAPWKRRHDDDSSSYSDSDMGFLW